MRNAIRTPLDYIPAPAIATLLYIACVVCIVSLRHTLDDVPPMKRLYLWQAVCERGILNIGPLEKELKTVRLTDLSTAHDRCGPTCPMKAKEVGR